MSTADSYLNAGAVAFVHDSIKPIMNISEKVELKLSKLLTLLMGVGAIFLALSFDNLLSIILFTQQFWGPIIAVPLIIGLLGYKPKSQAVYAGMIAGMALHISWRVFSLDKIVGIPSLIPSFMLSALTIFAANAVQQFLLKSKEKPAKLV
jgi:SSS family solute:Na+ symporter